MKNRKTIKSDYSKANLPKTRTEQFGRILKDNFVIFIKLGLILMVLMLPFVFAFVMKNISISNLMKDTSISEIDRANNYKIINIIFGAIYLPCVMFLFFGLTGVLKILRRLIWDEPLFFIKDFFQGIKESCGAFLLYGFLTGLVSFLSILTFHLSKGYFIYVSYVLIGITFAIVVSIILIAAYISSIYNSKISVSFSTAGNLFLRRGIFTILILLILYSIYFVNLLSINLIYIIAIIFVLIIFLFPIWLLLSYINSFKMFDDFINICQYPDKAYLGLFVNIENMKKILKKDKNNN